MTTKEAIVALTKAGWIKFPEPETRSAAAIKKNIDRRLAPPKTVSPQKNEWGGPTHG